METTALKMFTDTIQYEEELIWIVPVCEFFKINIQNQQRKLKNDPILRNLWTNLSTDLGKIDKNGRILLSKKGFSRWIQTINENTIDENLRENFITYQTLLHDFLYGSAEIHTAIRKTRAELDEWTAMYSNSGNMVKRKKKELDELLNNMFQYKLPFAEQKSIE